MIDKKITEAVERRLLLNPGDLPWLPRALEIYEEEKEKEKNAENGLLTTAGEKPAHEDNGWFPVGCCD